LKILGLHFGSHDASATLVIDGELIAVMEEERFNHKKHTNVFPAESISFCLEQGELNWSDIDLIAYANNAEITNVFKNNFIDMDYEGAFTPPMSSQKHIEAELRKEFAKHWGNVDTKLFYTDHHTAHAASVFYLSPYKESAIFTVDGMGNWITTTSCIGKDDDIKTLHRIGHPHSLGLCYGAVTQYAGFKGNCDEGKTMGLAPYGKPKYVDFFQKICRVEGDLIELDLSYFEFHKNTLLNSEGHARRWYSERMVEALGSARVPESEITDHFADVACSIQQVYEAGCYTMLEHLYKKTGNRNLCLSGGGALNCSMNGRISTQTSFDNVFVMPAPNDAGLSIGAAMVAERKCSPKTFKRNPLLHAYYGSEHSEEEIKNALSNLRDPHINISKPKHLVEIVADKLVEFEIVGWYQGRMEFGPRALGHRSILANPTRADSKNHVNSRVKFRENFRPFAPITPLEEARNYFKIDGESPYMLKITPVKEKKQSIIPAVTHVDGSARVQTVTRDQNEQIYDLLYCMKKRIGVPVLLNTSFNVRGNTIVRTPSDALSDFLNTGMSSLVIGPYLLSKLNPATLCKNPKAV
jgi:carbamoyltransferase